MGNFDSTYRGLVVRNNDPQASARVVLRIPQVLGTAESAWARPSAFASSVPNVGDAVYVTFEGGDLSQPVYTPLTTVDTTVAPIPKPPTGVVLSAEVKPTDEGVSFVDITATWTAPTENQDGSVPIHLAGYLVYLSTDEEIWGAGDYADVATFTYRGLLPGNTYFFRVASLNESLARSATVATGQIAVPSATPPADSLLGQHSETLVDLQITLDGKSSVTYSTGTPGSSANSLGDIWFQYVTGGTIIAQWTGLGGTDWQPNTLRDEVIASVNAGKILTGALQAATTIIVGTPEGARIEIAGGGGTAGITAYDGSGGQTFRLNSSTGAATFKGDIVSGSTITGATYQTATSGSRLVMQGGADANTLYAYTGRSDEQAPAGITASSDSGGLALTAAGISATPPPPGETVPTARLDIGVDPNDATRRLVQASTMHGYDVLAEENIYLQSDGSDQTGSPNSGTTKDGGHISVGRPRDNTGSVQRGVHISGNITLDPNFGGAPGYGGDNKIHAKGAIVLESGASLVADTFYIDNTGQLRSTSSGVVVPDGLRTRGLVDLDDTGWVTCTLNSPYVWQSGGAEAIQVRKRFGVVYIRGAVSNSSVTVNATHTVASLPSGFAPVKNVVNSCGTSTGASAAVAFVTAAGDLQIRTNGTLSSYYFFGGFTWLTD